MFRAKKNGSNGTLMKKTNFKICVYMLFLHFNLCQELCPIVTYPCPGKMEASTTPSNIKILTQRSEIYTGE